MKNNRPGLPFLSAFICVHLRPNCIFQIFGKLMDGVHLFGRCLYLAAVRGKHRLAIPKK